MKEKILVAGASGALGMEIMSLLKQAGFELRALVHSPEGAAKAESYTKDVWIADAAENDGIHNITEGIHSIISAMGKSVSLFSPDEHSFMENDFFGNNHLLQDAKRNKVGRFIYVSIKGADFAQEYEIAKAHKRFEEALESSGIDYTIVRPVGFFSGLTDLAIMAKRKVIPVIGNGAARTNSIHQKDLAKAVVSYLNDGPQIVELGGPLVHTRMEMAEMIKEKIGGKIFQVPEKLADIGMILPGMFSDDIFSKLEFFKYITSNDMIGEKTGTITFQEYLDNLDIKNLP